MARRVSSPVFVGRVEELALLRGAMSRASDRQPGITIVEGDAGIGKTRLLAEVARRTAADGALTLIGGSPATGLDTAPFGPLVEALRQIEPVIALGILDSMSPSTAELVRRLLPALGSPLDHEPSATADPLAQGRLLEALLDFLGSLAGRQPLLLVLEDLHWADRSTLAFLAFMSRNLRAERLHVVGTIRTDDLTAADTVSRLVTELSRSGLADRISLSGLERSGIRSLVEVILGRVPDEVLVDAIFARSDGNPFYAEELLAVAPDIATAVTPTLREIVSGRLARLSQPARFTLRAAAVAGADVRAEVLAAATGTASVEVEAHLHEGLEQHLLAVREDRLAFRHALVREILYADLLTGERREMHRRIAIALEKAGASDIGTAASIAHHWDAGGEVEQAFRAHLAAAGHARDASAAGDEHRHLERALELVALVDAESAAGVDLTELRRRAAETALTSGDFARAASLAQSAIAHLPSDIGPIVRGDHLRLLGQCLLEAGDAAEAKRAAEAAAGMLSGSPTVELAATLALLGRIAMTGQYPDGPRHAEQGIEVARAVGALAIEADLTNTLAVLRHMYGDYRDSVQLVRTALALAERARDTYGILRALNNLASLLDEVEGRTREALDLALEGAALAAGSGLQHSSRGSSLATTIADLSFRLGRWDLVESAAGPSISQALRGGFAVGPAFHFARVRLLRGDLDEAERWFSHVRNVGAGSQFVFNQGLWWTAMANLESMRDHNHDRAAAAVMDGLRVMDATTMVWPTTELTAIGLRVEHDRRNSTGQADQARAELLIERARHVASSAPGPLPPMGKAWFAVSEAEWTSVSGEPSIARWADAVADWQRLEYPFEEARARLAEAEALLFARRPRAEAAATLREALRISRELGTGPLGGAIEQLAHRAGLNLVTAAPLEGPLGPRAKVPRPDLGLSPRETEVLALVATGRSNGEIGRALFITTRTASSHVAHILDKLGVSSRTEAAVVAARLGLLDEPQRDA